MQSSNYTCEVASYTREVASSKLYNSFLSHIRCLCKTSNPFFHSCIVFSFFCTAKARTLKRNDDPTRKDSSIHRFKHAGICHCSMFLPSILFFCHHTSFFLPHLSHMIQPFYVFLRCLMFLQKKFCRIGRFSKVH